MRMALELMVFSVAERRPAGASRGCSCGLEVQQIALGIEPVAARVAAEAGAGDNAVTGYEDRDGIAAICLPDRARHPAGDGGDIGVGAGLAVRYVAQRLPDAPAIGGPRRGERQVERIERAVEIGVELLQRAAQQLR